MTSNKALSHNRLREGDSPIFLRRLRKIGTVPGSWLRWASCGLLACAILASGCRQPTQISPENRKLIKTLRTAVAAKRTDWLDANAKQIDERHNAAQLSDEEYATFQAIIAKARADQWADAETQVNALAQGQHPTQADLDRIKPGQNK